MNLRNIKINLSNIFRKNIGERVKVWIKNPIFSVVIVALLFFVMAAVFILPSYSIHKDNVIKNLSITQLPSTPGQPIKWIKKIAVNQINEDTHLVEIPKIATKVSISTSTIKNISPVKTSKLTNADRKKLSALAAQRVNSTSTLQLAEKIKQQKIESTKKLTFFQKIFRAIRNSISNMFATVEDAVAPAPETTIIDVAPVVSLTQDQTQTPVSTDNSSTPIADNSSTTTSPDNSIPVQSTSTDSSQSTSTAPATPEISTTSASTTQDQSVSTSSTSASAQSTSASTTSTSSDQSIATSTGTSTALVNASSTASTTVDVIYETPAPTITEANTDTGKIVTISATDTSDTPITNVLAYANIPKIYKVGQEDKIKIKWVNNGDQNVVFKAYDLNKDGWLDYVEWTVPHLSTQTFEIIFISKAFQLDTDQSILADIYDSVKTKDGNYATISDGQYVRTTFNQILTKGNDITIYAKPTNTSGSASIEVYPVYVDAEGNQTEGDKLTLVNDDVNSNFDNINHTGKYRILLKNLVTPTNIFDLKVTGNIDIDYIVDPVPTPFISTWDTRNTSSGSSADNQIHIPLIDPGRFGNNNTDTQYGFTVDWGDGNTDTITSFDDPNTTHTYSTAGVYTLTITGTLVGWSFALAPINDSKKIIEISQWGSLVLLNTLNDNDFINGWASYYYIGYFAGTSNLSITATDTLNTASTTEMMSAFDGSGISTVPSMNSWDMSNVRSMNSMFANTPNFNQPIGNWKTSNVWIMKDMFANATAFNQPIGNWDVGSLQMDSCQGMFRNATSFNQPLNGWHFRAPNDFRWMFSGATSFDQNISTFDFTNLGGIYLAGMFDGVTLSTTTYDAILMGWGNPEHNAGNWPTGVTFSAGSSTYDYSASLARQHLVNTLGWTITDGGPSWPASDATLLIAATTTAQGLIDANAPESTDIPGNHLPGSLATLQTALGAVYADISYPQSVVDEQTLALNTAIDTYNTSLVLPSNVDALNSARNDASTILLNYCNDDYRPGCYPGWLFSTLNGVVEQYSAVDNTYTQGAVDWAAGAIRGAIDTFSWSQIQPSYTGNLEGARSRAQGTLNNCSSYDQPTCYPPSSFESLSSTLNSYSSVDSNSPQGDVDSATNVINDACNSFDATQIPLSYTGNLDSNRQWAQWMCWDGCGSSGQHYCSDRDAICSAAGSYWAGPYDPQGYVESMAQQIQAAIDTYNSSPLIPYADTSGLDFAKSQAQDLINQNAPESSTPGDHIVGSLQILSGILWSNYWPDINYQSSVDAATAAINDAISAYYAAIVPSSDVTDLNFAISVAQTFITENAPESYTLGNHMPGSLSALSLVLASATSTVNDPQSVVYTQTSDLNNAIKIYNASVISAFMPDASSDIELSQQAVISNSITNLSGILTQNQSVHNLILGTGGYLDLAGHTLTISGTYTNNGGTLTDSVGGGAMNISGAHWWEYSNASEVINGATINYLPNSDDVNSDVSIGSDVNTKLLLHMDGTNGSNNFVDSELTPKTVTANGSAQISTTLSKFGASGQFNGSTDYLTIPASNDFNFGTGDFTIDGWFYFNSLGTQIIASDYNANNEWGDAGWAMFIEWGQFSFLSASSHGWDNWSVYHSSFVPQIHTWTHLAVVRHGNVFTLYANGQSVMSGTYNDGTGNYSGQLVIGARSNGSASFDGYMDELRISKGVARWTDNFTPSSSPYGSDTKNISLFRDSYIRNIAINAGSTLNLAGHSLTISGTYTNSGGTLTDSVGGGSIDYAGPWWMPINVGGSGITVNYSANSSEVISDLVLSTSTRLYRDAYIHNLTLATGGTLDLNGHTLNISGHWWNFNNTGGTLIKNGGTINYISKIPYPLDTVSDATIDTSITLDRDQSVNNLTLASGGTLDLNGHTLNVSGNWTNSGGTLINHGGTVNLTGTNQSILGTNTFANLVKQTPVSDSLYFDGTASTTITDSISLNGSLGNLLTIKPISGISNGLILSLPFNSPNPTVDMSSNNNNIVVSGATYNSTGGIDSSGAYTFNGSNVITIPSLTQVFGTNNSFTFTAWIKVPNPCTGGNVIFTKSVAYQDNVGDMILQTGTNCHLYATVQSNSGWYPGFLSPLGTATLTSDWTFVALTISQNSFKTYVNGQLDINRPGVSFTENINSKHYIRLGTQGSSNSEFGERPSMVGTIDGVKIFNRQLSQEEISSIYNARERSAGTFSILKTGSGNVSLSHLSVASSTNLSSSPFVCTKCINGGGNTNWTFTAPEALTSVIISPISPTVYVGATTTFSATTLDQYQNPFTATTTWTSSASSIGTISSSTGLFNALAIGTTTVTATAGNVSSSTLVTVSRVPPRLGSITISPLSQTVGVGSTIAFTYHALDQYGAPYNTSVSWTSSNNSVGSIDSSGFFTAVSSGATTITATAGNLSNYTSVIVTARGKRVSLTGVGGDTDTSTSTASSTIFSDIGNAITNLLTPKEKVLTPINTIEIPVSVPASLKLPELPTFAGTSTNSFTFEPIINTFLSAALPEDISSALSKSKELKNYLATVGVAKIQDFVSLDRKPITVVGSTVPTDLFSVLNGTTTIKTYITNDINYKIIQTVRVASGTELTVSFKPKDNDLITGKWNGNKVSFVQQGKQAVLKIIAPSMPGKYYLSTSASPLPLVVEVLDLKTIPIAKTTWVSRVLGWFGL